MNSEERTGSGLMWWGLPVIPLVIPVVFFLLNHGIFSQKQFLMSIGAVVLAAVITAVLILVPHVKNWKKVRKSQKLLTEISGIIGLERTGKQVRQMSRNDISPICLISYDSNGAVSSVRIRSHTDLDSEAVENLKKISQKVLLHGSGVLVVNMSETTRREVFLTRSSASDDQADEVTRETLRLKDLFRTEFSERARGSTVVVDRQRDGVLMSFLLTNLPTVLPSPFWKNIRAGVSEVVPPVDGARWQTVWVSDSVMKLSQTRDDDDDARALIGRSAYAALKVAGSYSRVDGADILIVKEVENTLIPALVVVHLLNTDDLSEDPARSKFSKGFVRILNSLYKGQWNTTFDGDDVYASRSDQ